MKYLTVEMVYRLLAVLRIRCYCIQATLCDTHIFKSFLFLSLVAMTAFCQNVLMGKW